MQHFNLEDSIHILLHDLREPINTVLSIHDLYREKLQNLSEDTELDYYLIVKHSCQTALTLINDLMEIYKLESEEEAMKMATTNLNKLLEYQIRLFSYQAQNRQLKVHSFLPAKDVFIDVDVLKFERCLQNLLSNSFKFTPDHGKITLTLTQKHEMISIAIEDTGIGIPEDMIPHLFRKFTPASRQGLNGESSTGLGLYSAKRLVELHKGNISVESHVGRGTCFKIEIPANVY